MHCFRCGLQISVSPEAIHQKSYKPDYVIRWIKEAMKDMEERCPMCLTKKAGNP